MKYWNFGQILNNGFQNEPQQGFVEVTPDAGIPFRRLRFSDIRDIISGTFTLDKTDYINFMSWYNDDIKQGTEPFYYYDCRIEAYRTARITGKPTYSSNSKYFNVNITLTLDPEIFYQDGYLVLNDSYMIINTDSKLVLSKRYSL